MGLSCLMPELTVETSLIYVNSVLLDSLVVAVVVGNLVILYLV